METIGRIRREHFAKGKSIKEIVRELKVSQNTVRKVLRSQATAFAYARSVQPHPKLGAWQAELDRMLAANEAKSPREWLTLIRLFEELRELCCEGGYDAPACPRAAPSARLADRGSLRPAEFCPGRGLPVRLVA